MKHLKKGYVFLIALGLSSSLLTGCKSSEVGKSNDIVNHKEKVMEVSKEEKDNQKIGGKKEAEKLDDKKEEVKEVKEENKLDKKKIKNIKINKNTNIDKNDYEKMESNYSEKNNKKQKNMDIMKKGQQANKLKNLKEVKKENILKEVKKDSEVKKEKVSKEVKKDSELKKEKVAKEVKKDSEAKKEKVAKEVKKDNEVKKEKVVKEIKKDNEINNKKAEKDKLENKETERIDLVKIQDEKLRQVINRALGRNLNSKENITISDMESITEIDSGFLPLNRDESGEPRRGIRNLNGLEYAKNLKSLKTSMNAINDLSPLKNLTNLEYLEVYRNDISDLTPLRNLKNLQHLDIYNNTGIFDLEPISELNKINFIDMHYCNRRTKKITSDYLGKLTNLEFLSIDDNFVDDVSFVKNLKKLSTFSCNNSYVTDLTYVQDLASDSFEDWSGKKFFNMYGQMLKDDIKVYGPGEGFVYKMKSPVTGIEKYIDKIYKTYDLSEGLPAISIRSENDNINFTYNKDTDELELKVGKNTTENDLNIKYNVLLEYGMYNLKMNFDIKQDKLIIKENEKEDDNSKVEEVKDKVKDDDNSKIEEVDDKTKEDTNSKLDNIKDKDLDINNSK